MQSQNKFFEDLAKVVNGAAGTVAGMAREAQDAARDRAREFVGGMDLVSRDEFQTLKDRLTALEAELAALKGEAAPAAAAKGPAVKAGAKKVAPKKPEA